MSKSRAFGVHGKVYGMASLLTALAFLLSQFPVFTALQASAESIADGLYSSYFSSDLTASPNLTDMPLATYWSEGNDGTLTRTGTSTYSHTANMAVLYYKLQTYTDFDMTVTYKSLNATGCYVGFGADMGKSWRTDVGGTLLFVRSDGLLQYAPTASLTGSGFPDGWLPNTTGNLSTKVEGWSVTAVHTLRILMKSGVYQVWVDGYNQGTRTAVDYAGGYIYFASNVSGVQFGVPTITDLNAVGDYASYFSSDLTASATLNKTIASTYWTQESDGMLTRTGADSLSHTNNMAVLYYKKQTYVNFDMTLTYKSRYDSGCYVGFGADFGQSWRSDVGGTVLFIRGDGLIQRAPSKSLASNAFSDGWMPNSAGQLSAKVTGWDVNAVHTLRIRMENGSFQVWVDGYSQGAQTAVDYTGGYIYVASNLLNDQFSMPTITDLGTDDGDFTGYTSYYSDNIGAERGDTYALAASGASNYWTHYSTGKIVRKATSGDVQDDLQWAQLYLGNQTHKNFTMELDITPGTNGWQRAVVGIGGQLGYSFQEAGGGVITYQHAGNKIVLNGNVYNTDGGNGFVWGTPSYTAVGDATQTYHLKIVVQDRLMSVYINDETTPTKFALPAWYDGGYLYIAANSTDAAFENITITDADADAGDSDSALYQKSVLFAGDSIAAGAEDEATYWAYAGRIASAASMDWINTAMGGYTYSTHPTLAADGTIESRMTPYLANDYDYIILQGGVNDAMRHRENSENCQLGAISDSYDPADFDIDTFAGAFEHALYTATTAWPDAHIGYIVTYQNQWIAKAETDPYYTLAIEICQKWSVPVLNLNTNDTITQAFLTDTTPYYNIAYLADGIHPGAAGYDFLVAYIRSWMEELTAYAGHAHAILSADGITGGTLSASYSDGTASVTTTAETGYRLKAGSLKYSTDGTVWYPISERYGAVSESGAFNPDSESQTSTFVFSMPDADVTVTAEFVAESEANLAVLGASIGIAASNQTDLRFVSRVYRTYAGKSLTACGTILLAADRLDESAYAAMKAAYDAQDYAALYQGILSGGEGYKGAVVPSTKLIDRCDAYVDYSCLIFGAGAETYRNSEFIAISYAVYEDTTVFSAPLTRSFSEVAAHVG